MTSAFKVEPLTHAPEKKCEFGAVITGLDLNKITDQDVARLRQELWKHKIIIVKGQDSLEPRKNWDLIEKLDPNASKASEVPTEELADLFYPDQPQFVQMLKYVTAPDLGHTIFIGKGDQSEGKYGTPGVNLGELNFLHYYSKPLPTEDFEKNGLTRFHWWHLDGTFFKYDPPLFTSIRPLILPDETKTQKVEWADGSGNEITVKPGRTAFVSTVQLYNMLSEEEKQMADHSWVEYMYSPYEWIKGARGNPTGMGITCEGRETPMEQMERFNTRPREWQKRYPLVWINPVTGEKSFQVQSNCAHKIYIRHSPSETARVIDDLTEVRKFLYDIQSRIILPEHIWVGPGEVGDVLLFQNWGMMHSKIDYPLSYGNRSCHQDWMPGNTPPVGPVPIPDIGKI